MAARKKFLLVPLGSWGDVYPFVWLGKELAASGHEVVAITHPPFDDGFRQAGIRPLAFGTREEYDAILQDPDLWHPRKGFELVARHSQRVSQEVIPLIRVEADPGRTLLVGAGIAF